MIVTPIELEGSLVTSVASWDDLGSVLEELVLAVQPPIPWNPWLLLPLNTLTTFIPCPLAKTDQLPVYCT